MWLLLGVVGAALFYYFIVKPFHYWTEKGVKQSNTKWVVGDNWGLLSGKQSFPDLLETIYNQWPGVRYSGIYQFFIPTLVLKDPDLIKQVTIKDFDHFTDHRSFIPEDIDPLWGKNLIALNGQKWREMRTILSPSFTSSKMKTMFALISECAENFVKHFQKKDQDVVTIEFKDTFTRLTNDVIATSAFGITVDSLGQPNNRFYLMGEDATDFTSFRKVIMAFGYVMFPKLFSLLKVKIFSNEVREYFNAVVEDTIKTREEKGIVRPDMIHLLLEARKGISKENEKESIDTGFATAQEAVVIPSKGKTPKDLSNSDIVAQAMIFFFAGFDSVSSLMSFMAYELAANPEIQERLRQEIKSTLKQSDGKLTYEDLMKMKYMDMVVSETLRKWPIASITDRICTKPYTIQPVTPEEEPLQLNVGDVLWFPIFSIHRDAQYYPNPERFDPERFNDENKDNIKPYTYFPFGLGPRNCIGSRFALLETKILFFHILNSFELVPVEKSEIPLKLTGKLFTLKCDSFWFGLKRIKS